LLEAPPSQSSAAYAINNRWDIAGWTGSDSQVSEATIWAVGSATITAQLMVAGTSAYDINDHGVSLVSTFNPANGALDPGVWIPKRELFQQLPASGVSAVQWTAYEINNRGDIIGSALHQDGTGHLVMWTIEHSGAV
jgi:hypothetical protein